MDCSCAPILQFFSVASDGAKTECQIQNCVFWSISCQFEEGQRRQLCIDLGAVFDICYGTDALCNALNISQIRLQMAPQDSKIAVEIVQNVNNRTQSLRKILRMIITDIVINTLLGRVTRHPAGMHCPARDDAFVSSCLITQVRPILSHQTLSYSIKLCHVIVIDLRNQKKSSFLPFKKKKIFTHERHK